MKKIFTILGGICIVILSTISFIFAYTQEQREAYEWAYKYKITTQPTIETANLDGNITRQAFAKMIVNYLENVIGINQTSLASCKFSDENKITNDLKHYSKKTCSYKIMGSDGTNFNPTKPLTRVQLGTVLSRIIWGDRYNISGEQYYINHLNALKQNGIMSNIGNYQSNAKRGDVLIMLKRLYEKFGSNIYMNQLYHGSENNIYIDSAAKDNIITERDNSVSLAKENSVSVEKNDGNVDGDIIRILKHDVYNTTRKGTNVIKYDDGLYERVDQNGNKFKFSKITISDGNNSITMMDRNLGASNATSEGRKDDYDGCYFQWGNNNCFTGKAEYADGDNYLRTDILHETPEHFTKSNNYTINPVKWSNEYLHKGYFGSEFVVGLRDYWENAEHYNEVWGGEKDGGENNWGWNTRKETQINRQGPCPEGWHIPSIGERRKVIEIYMKDNGIEADGLTKILDDGLSSDFSDYFFLPNASNLNYDNMYNPGWYNAGVWTSSPYFEDENSAYVMYVYPTQYIDGNTFWSRGYGFPVRCFQNYDK